MTTHFQPRFVAYCASIGVAPKDVRAGAAFVAWVGEQWDAWEIEVDRRTSRFREPLTGKEHAAFDAWLQVKFVVFSTS